MELNHKKTDESKQTLTVVSVTVRSSQHTAELILSCDLLAEREGPGAGGGKAAALPG